MNKTSRKLLKNGQKWDPALYANPLPSTRTGPLYNAFSYPTKISAEAIAVFIACHTQPGEVVLDTFAGSGTAGLGALLCDKPTPEMIKMAQDLGVSPVWGPRRAVLYELSTVGAFVAKTMCQPPNPAEFEKAAETIISRAEEQLGDLYQTKDPAGRAGRIRHTIWTDLLVCPSCNKETSFSDAVIKRKPLRFATEYICQKCHEKIRVDEAERATEKIYDPILGKKIIRRKRVPAYVYGETDGHNWQRIANSTDLLSAQEIENSPKPNDIPVQKVQWGDLYRSGYHTGLTHIHHFYTSRNLRALAGLWREIDRMPKHLQPSLKLLVLSYNTAHSTLMTRVVVKNGQKDFVLTGAQSGVLYISSLPVEKNVFEGVRRKIKTLKSAFSVVRGSRSNVSVHNASSVALDLKDASVNYVFTDPPFGDYIPYSEINQISEAWLGTLTDNAEEIIVSSAQEKGVTEYSSLMGKVFAEISRVLSDDGLATVVFHSSKAAVWRGLMQAYQGAGLSVRASSVLDKVQTSFKQTVSTVSVKGDPLLLLSKGIPEPKPVTVVVESEEMIDFVLTKAFRTSADSQERTAERLYSRYVSGCLERGISTMLSAEPFYARVRLSGAGV